MNTDLLILLLVAAIVTVCTWPTKPARREPRASGPMTGRELSGLILVDYNPDLVLVSPRDVELPYCEDWSLDDVVDTLVQIDAL